MDNARSTTRPHVARGVAAGFIGGIVGGWAMTQFHTLLYGGGVTGTHEPQSHRPVDEDGDAAMKAAAASYRAAAGDDLAYKQKQSGGVIVHYAFAASCGAAYGLAVGVWPTIGRGFGLPFGAVLWLAADELAMPLLGLAKGPAAYPATVHAEMLAAHLVYGAATHGTARLIGLQRPA
jgi:hypothetical protein